MHNVVIEEPYEFVPPVYGDLWPNFIQTFLGPHLLRTYGVHSMEARDVHHMQESLDAGNGVLVAPNHCRLCDPLTLSCVTKKVKRNMHAMASWHLFKSDWLTRFALRRMGAFSVYREGTDRQAINTGVDILVDGKRPLVVFAEGAVSRHNDVVNPLMDGTAFIARTAAKRRQKLGISGGIVVHPVAIRYFFQGDLESSVLPVLEEIESHFAWHPQKDKSIVERLHQIGQALLSLKEIEYLGSARTGDFYERVEQLIEESLTNMETEWNVKNSGEGVVSRVKNLRMAILPDMVTNNVSEQERQQRWKQLAQCYYIQQMSHYPRRYVRQSEPNIIEHLLETVERFEEDFTDKVRAHPPLHVVVQVGKAIQVDVKRDRKAAVDPVMEGIRVQLTQMLTELAKEARVVEVDQP